MNTRMDRHVRCSTLVVAAVVASAQGAEIVINQKNVSWVPQTVTAFPGDTVRWVYSAGFHTVTSGANCTADGLFDGLLTLKSPSFVWTVPASAAGSSVEYYCDPHCIFGMTGTIQVGTEHVVTQSGLAFVPASITVAPGDRVRWVRTAGAHTVTSGVDCTADAVYFDGLLTLTSTEFVWDVPQSAAGQTIPYFCSPHCIFGMTASITVSGGGNPADVNGDGSVNAVDLAIVLGDWGATSGPADINRDGIVNATDLATLLAAWSG